MATHASVPPPRPTHPPQPHALTGEEGKADEEPFPEYVERPRVEEGDAPLTISQGAGKGFYVQIEEAVDTGDSDPLIDLDRAIPDDWQLPPVRKLGS